MNWLLGFVMGVLLAAGYNRIDGHQRGKETAGRGRIDLKVPYILDAYRSGSSRRTTHQSRQL
jgi:hypothetical protein